MSTNFLLLVSKNSRRPAGRVGMDIGILGLIQHRKACWDNSLATPEYRILFRWEGRVRMAPPPLFGAGMPLLFHQ